MTKVAGTKGYVGVSTAVAGINQWSLDYTIDPLETTDFSASGVATYTTGITRWSGNFSGFKDGVPQSVGASVNLFLAEYPSAGSIWKGVAFITGIHPANTFDGLVQYSYDFQGDGALTAASTG